MTDRLRRKKPQATRVKTKIEFLNPYPWMSSIEAMVHLELEHRRVPFSWRYFDGEAIHLTTLMPSFSPEFTLREYKIVILIIGNFFGTLPGILDENALAQSLLEADGWTVVTLFEDEIRSSASNALDAKAPQLKNGAFQGPPRPNPYGIPDFMEKRRAQLRGQGLRRAKFKTGAPSGTHRRKRIGGDLGRLRRGSGS